MGIQSPWNGSGRACSRRAAVALAALLLMAAPRAEAGDELVQARLVSETAALKPGTTAWMAVELKMKPGWHTYWRNPGDAGQPTGIGWTLPEGYAPGDIRWPVPKPFVAEMVTSYGYEDRVALLVPVSVPASARPGDRPSIAADVNWLACERICIPGEAKLSLELPVAADAAPDAANAALFARARDSLPRPAKDVAAGRATDDAIRLDLPKALLEGMAEPEVTFLPFDDALIEHGAVQRLERAGGSPVLTLRRGPKLGRLSGEFPGLLLVRDKARAAQQAYDLTVAMTVP